MQQQEPSACDPHSSEANSLPWWVFLKDLHKELSVFFSFRMLGSRLIRVGQGLSWRQILPGRTLPDAC